MKNRHELAIGGAFLNIFATVAYIMFKPNISLNAFYATMMVSTVISAAGAGLIRIGKEKSGAILIIAGSVAFIPIVIGLVGVCGGINVLHNLKRGNP